MSTLSSLLAMAAILAITQDSACSQGIPYRLTPPWRIEIGPGIARIGEKEVQIQSPKAFDATPPEMISIQDEKQEALPLFRPQAGGWMKGLRLNRLKTEECTATGLLNPGSLRVKSEAGQSGVVYERGKDYEVDDFWGTVGRLEAGAIREGQGVFVDYQCTPCRLDTIVLTSGGEARYLQGEPGVGLVYPAREGEGEVPVVRLWFEGKMAGLTDDSIFPVTLTLEEAVSQLRRESQGQAEKNLPRTLSKLRKGEPVTVVAWGDSVTAGGGVENDPSQRYQEVFAHDLRERFPKSAITLVTAAWGGRGSRDYLEAPSGGEKDFVRDVLEPNPDLVIIEFVNDAYLDEERSQAHYARILSIFREHGIEVILLTPHLVRPDWMDVKGMKFEEDPRPYVKGLRKFARENGVALADASRIWCQLWQMGIPYITLETNSINHPDERGHRIFSDALMALFPES